MKNKSQTKTFPLALPAPDSATTLLTRNMLAPLIEQARMSPRRRMILPLHKTHQANPQRMLNCLQPDSYIRPHRHLHPPKTETVLLIQGILQAIFFTDTGKLASTHVLEAGGSDFGIDTEPGVFHTFIALAPDTVFLEIKPGPYDATNDKDFASWAPAELSDEAGSYFINLKERAIKDTTLRS